MSISAAPSVFTPLHRWLGRDPQPLTIELLDAAVEADLEEKADLDFRTPLECRGTVWLHPGLPRGCRPRRVTAEAS